MKLTEANEWYPKFSTSCNASNVNGACKEHFHACQLFL